MASGSIFWHCSTCRENKARGRCAHPSARYYVVYRVGKRQRWQPVGRNKHDAERRLVEVLTQLHAGTYREVTPITFGDFADKWLRDYAEARVKPSTLRRYRSLVACYLKPAFGSLLLTELTPENVQRFVAETLRKERCAPATANRALTILKGMLKQARQWQHIRENPAQDIRPARVEPVEMDYLTPEEVRLLIEKADEPYRTLLLTAVLTGLRRAELLALQWGDIDWKAGVIHVRRSLWYDSRKEQVQAGSTNEPCWRFLTPKSKSSRRTVVLTPKLREALELHRISGPTSSHDLVFCSRDGTPIHPRNIIERGFWPALTRAELRRIRFHDLRHTYTALMIAQGFHAKFIQRQLGHASIQTTLDRYGHLLPDAQRAAGERLDALVFGAEQEAPRLTPV